MSGTATPPQTPTIRQEPSGATSITTAGAIVIILNYATKLRYGQDIPADVGMAIGILLTGAAHLVQMGWLRYVDARVQPKPILPPVVG
jgi:hypothetical protein